MNKESIKQMISLSIVFNPKITFSELLKLFVAAIRHTFENTNSNVGVAGNMLIAKEVSKSVIVFAEVIKEDFPELLKEVNNG